MIKGNPAIAVHVFAPEFGRLMLALTALFVRAQQENWVEQTFASFRVFPIGGVQIGFRLLVMASTHSTFVALGQDAGAPHGITGEGHQFWMLERYGEDGNVIRGMDGTVLR